MVATMTIDRSTKKYNGFQSKNSQNVTKVDDFIWYDAIP